MSDYDGPEGWAPGDDFGCLWCDEWHVTIDDRGLEFVDAEWSTHLDVCRGVADLSGVDR